MSVFILMSMQPSLPHPRDCTQAPLQAQLDAAQEHHAVCVQALNRAAAPHMHWVLAKALSCQQPTPSKPNS